MMVADRAQVLSHDLLSGDLNGKVLVGGAAVTVEALRKAVLAGAAGIIVGGIDNVDLAEFVGYDIGVPITGQEKVGLTLIITDGFGKTPMGTDSFKALSNRDGQLVSINGTTHLRANLIRPEIILYSGPMLTHNTDV